MDSLQIKTGEKHIAINDDPERVIIFNPLDVLFAERFYALIGEFKSKLEGYKAQAESLDKQTAKDSEGLPLNFADRLQVQKDACQYIRGQIDVLFGDGSAQKIFGDAYDLDMFPQFFDGLLPFIQSARNARLEKYSNKPVKRMKK